MEEQWSQQHWYLPVTGKLLYLFAYKRKDLNALLTLTVNYHKIEQKKKFKTTVNWLFTDLWCHLVIGCFDWKIVVFWETVVRVYYILKTWHSCSFLGYLTPGRRYASSQLLEFTTYLFGATTILSKVGVDIPINYSFQGKKVCWWQKIIKKYTHTGYSDLINRLNDVVVYGYCWIHHRSYHMAQININVSQCFELDEYFLSIMPWSI